MTVDAFDARPGPSWADRPISRNLGPASGASRTDARHWPLDCFHRRMTARGWVWLAVVMLSLLSAYQPVEGAVAVTLDPKSAVTVRVNGTRPFTATVSGATDGSVTWSLTPPPGVSASVIGSIDASGTYTAPASPLPGFASLTVIATSVALPTATASTTITVLN